MNNPVSVIMTTAIEILEFDENYLIQINQNNSDIIENYIKNDPDYRFAKSEQVFLSVWTKKSGALGKNDWFKVVKNISVENSTRTSSGDIQAFSVFILNPNNRFLERLKNGDWGLVDDLTKVGAKKNKSLASKVCKYLSEWIYGNDDFSINDSVVRSVLPYYLKKYGINRGTRSLEKMTYGEIMPLIQSLEDEIKKTDPGLNKNLIDHILWYGYKGDPIRREIAVAYGV